jgi:hypothetical protein
MGYKFNPFTGKFDTVDSPNGVFEEIEVNGDITLDGRFISSLNGAASAPPGTFTGTWFTGGTATTTKPQVLIEPAGTTSTAWSTSGTGLGVNAASGFAGNLLDLQLNGTSRAIVTGAGNVGIGTTSPNALLDVQGNQPTIKVLATNLSGATSSLELWGSAGGANYKSAIIQGINYGQLNLQTPSGIGVNSFITLATGATERARIDSSGRLLVGTASDSGGALFQVNGDRIRVGTAKTPATSGATGTTGEIAWDADYIYICTATNTWKRAAISTW